MFRQGDTFKSDPSKQWRFHLCPVDITPAEAVQQGLVTCETDWEGCEGCPGWGQDCAAVLVATTKPTETP